MNNLISKADILQLVPVSDFQRKLLKVYLFGGFRLISTPQNEGQNQSESSKKRYNAIEPLLKKHKDIASTRLLGDAILYAFSIIFQLPVLSKQRVGKNQDKGKKRKKIRKNPDYFPEKMPQIL